MQRKQVQIVTENSKFVTDNPVTIGDYVSDCDGFFTILYELVQLAIDCDGSVTITGRFFFWILM